MLLGTSFSAFEDSVNENSLVFIRVRPVDDRLGFFPNRSAVSGINRFICSGKVPVGEEEFEGVFLLELEREFPADTEIECLRGDPRGGRDISKLVAAELHLEITPTSSDSCELERRKRFLIVCDVDLLGTGRLGDFAASTLWGTPDWVGVGGVEGGVASILTMTGLGVPFTAELLPSHCKTS